MNTSFQGAIKLLAENGMKMETRGSGREFDDERAVLVYGHSIIKLCF